jgi:hypothetical protein
VPPSHQLATDNRVPPEASILVPAKAYCQETRRRVTASNPGRDARGRAARRAAPRYFDNEDGRHSRGLAGMIDAVCRSAVSFADYGSNCSRREAAEQFNSGPLFCDESSVRLSFERGYGD